MKNFILSLFIVLFLIQLSYGQNKTKSDNLLKISTELSQQWQIDSDSAKIIAKKKNIPIYQIFEDGTIISLKRFSNQIPIYYETNNLNSAKTISTNKLWNNTFGFDLSGNGETLGLWDGGAVLSTHNELTQRVTQRDNTTTMVAHSTHVAGTMIARGMVEIGRAHV